MDEKDSDIEDENNIINTNIINNKLEESNELINDKEKGKIIDIDIPFSKEKKENEIKLEDIKLGSKILCPNPDCFENCIINIDPNTFEVNYECKNHKDKMDIVDFVKNSGISKEVKEKCSECMKSYKEMKENKKKLYKCYCGNNICEDCKNEHIEQNKNNKKEHNMVDFEVKDYICNCNQGKKKFNNYCITCKKNICIICGVKHKDHTKINFGELFQLTKEKKEKIKKRIDDQKKSINTFNKIIDDWYKRIKKYIDIYKKRLELYNQINYIILKQYNSKKNNYQSIKNIEYIKTDFDTNFMDLTKEKKDYLSQHSIILKILNEIIEENIPKPKISNENILKELKLKYTIEPNEKVKHICELKKEDLLIVNIYNENINKNEILIYKKIKENFEKKFIINEDRKILNLKELKDGYLLIIKDNQFKIHEIKMSVKKDIQKRELDKNEYFKEIIELFNGNLISISYSDIDKDKNKIIFWKKDLMNGNYEIYKTIKAKDKPISILEINTNYYAVFYEDNNLYVYESKNDQLYRKVNIKVGTHFKKMIKIIEDGIVFLYEKYLILFSLSSFETKTFKAENNITDIYNISYPNHFLATYSEQNNNGLISYMINFKTLGISKNNVLMIKKDLHSMIITCIIQSKNGEIITGSDDKKIKIWNKI